MMMATMMAKMPSAEAKISITKICGRTGQVACEQRRGLLAPTWSSVALRCARMGPRPKHTASAATTSASAEARGPRGKASRGVDAHLHEEVAVLRVGQCAAAAADANAHAAREVAEAAADPRPKDSIAGPFLVDEQSGHVADFVRSLDFGLQDDGHDDAVDCDGLAEDDAAGVGTTDRRRRR